MRSNFAEAAWSSSIARNSKRSSEPAVKRSHAWPATPNVFEALRAQALSLTPAALNLAPLPSGVFGALMEFAYQATCVSLVAVLDGSTSLYFSTGGGIIGAGGNESVRKANRLFLETAGKFVAQFPLTKSFPTPGAGHARFYVLAAGGVHASSEIEE